MIRVLIADDEALVRSGLRMILESEADIEVAGEAADGKAALAQLEKTDFDVLLIDVRMPVMDGLEATRRILSRPGSKRTSVVVLTTFDLDEYVYDALRAGACGFLLKTSSPEDLVRGIRLAAQGETLLSPSVTRRLIERFVKKPPPSRLPANAELTDRESEVLKLIAGGLSNAEIAKRLFVSEATVKTHVNHIFAKLGIRDRAQAVVFAYESGLVTFEGG